MVTEPESSEHLPERGHSPEILKIPLQFKMANNWQEELSASFGTTEQLLDFLEIEAGKTPLLPQSANPFPLKVTRSFASRMEKGNPDDPLLRQVLPIEAENENSAHFLEDPVGDLKAIRTPGLLQKYEGRVLLVLTGACAIHCRYCFRRSFPYSSAQLNRSLEDQAIDFIQQDSSIREVILSGGDPLSLSDQRLQLLIDRLNQIPSLTRLRFHTRLPIVLPSRIDDALIAQFKTNRLQLVFVIHANHPNELSDEVADAISRLSRTGATLLNQAVLLRGVNDHVDTLHALSERLHAIGVLPYYLHMLDRAKGTHHFEVDETQAQQIHQGLMRRLPGYLVPKLVREVPGDPYKRPV